MKQMKNALALLLALMMLLSLCGCGSLGRRSQSVSTPVPRPEANYSSGSSYYAAEEMDYEAPMADVGDYYEEGAAVAGFSSVAASAAQTAAKGGSGNEVPEEESENPDKIIYSSDVTVETTDFDGTIGKIAGLVETYGGWIESSSVSGSNYYQKSRGTASTRDASYTLRIPSSRFQALMDSLSDLGNVPYSHIYTENVTSQYYDAQAHLKAYQTQENRLLEMMELAETVEDVIIIEDRLTELRYQIESLQSRLKNWDRRVAYSTISLSIKEVREYTPEEKVNPTYGEELAQALKDGLSNAGQFLKDLLVFLVEVLPVLIILIPVIWLVVWLLGKLIRKLKVSSAARKEARRAKKAQKAARKNAEELPAAAAEEKKD